MKAPHAEIQDFYNLAAVLRGVRSTAGVDAVVHEGVSLGKTG
jgi:hypothetical protein